PTALAASMYGLWRIESTSDRSVRAAVGVSRTARAMITLFTDWPRAAISESARMMGGSAISVSTTRWLALSATPPTYAVTTPQRPPSVTPTSTETSPTQRDRRAPQITRLSMSRPRWSVPSGNATLGGRYGENAASFAPWGASSGAKTAVSTRTTTIPAPAAPSGWRPASLPTVRKRGRLTRT